MHNAVLRTPEVELTNVFTERQKALLNGFLHDITKEYNQRIGDLACLTAELPKRLRTTSARTRGASRPRSLTPTYPGNCIVATPIKNAYLHEALPPFSPLSDAHMEPADIELALDACTSNGENSDAPAKRFRIKSDSDEKCDKVDNSTGWELKLSDPRQELAKLSRSSSDIHGRFFVLKSEWTKPFSKNDKAALLKATRSKFLSKDVIEEDPLNESEEIEKSTDLPKYCRAASPAASTRLAWEVCSLLLVVFDLVSIPLMLTFQPPSGSFIEAMDYITLIFWSLNIPVALSTGFYAKGYLVRSHGRIFLRYAKTWLVVDTITVTNHWMLVFSRNKDGYDDGSYLNLFRMLRLLRLARLVRILKLGRVWNYAQDFTDSETLAILLQVIKMLLVLLMINHFIACTWYQIGDSETGQSWTKHRFALQDVSWAKKYLVSYHWSLTQFTPASMDVQPRSETERVFAILIVVSGLVGFSYLVGSINLSLGRLRILGEKKANCFRELSKFLKYSRVPHELSARIRNYVESRFEHQQKHKKEDHIELLKLLSDNLQADLAWALRGHNLCIHPLFDLNDTANYTLKKVACKGVTQLSLAPRDVVFATGEEATHMSIVSTGELKYEREDPKVVEAVYAVDHVIAEPVLWLTCWHHMGDLRAKTSSEMLLISPQKFTSFTTANPVAHEAVRLYAGQYLAWLNSEDKEDLTDIATAEYLTQRTQEFVLGLKKANGSECSNQRKTVPKSLAEMLLRPSVASKVFGVFKPSESEPKVSMNTHAPNASFVDSSFEQSQEDVGRNPANASFGSRS